MDNGDASLPWQFEYCHFSHPLVFLQILDFVKVPCMSTIEQNMVPKEMDKYTTSTVFPSIFRLETSHMVNNKWP